MIKVLRESVNPYWFVNYDYEGDAISDYQSTVLVQAKDEASAISRAKKVLSKTDPTVRAFEIVKDRKLGKNTTLADFRRTYPYGNYKVINESIDEMDNEVTPTSAESAVPTDIMQDIPENAPDANGDVVEPDQTKEREIDYTDPKYQKIIDYLNSHGYEGSKFLGKMGFSIPQHTSYVSIVFDDIFAECSIMTTRFRLSQIGATEYMSELAAIIPIVEDINAILSDATTAETKDRHINESEVIESGNQKFGSPGTYILYRNGGHQTQRGFIGFSDTKAGADKYAQSGRKTECFAVTINNPFIARGDSSYEAFAYAYKSLTGNDPQVHNETTKINDAWRDHDKEIANALASKGYDALIYIVPQNNEVNVIGTDIDKMPNVNEYRESVPQALGLE